MKRNTMNAVLAEMTLEEIRRAPWYLDIFQRAGSMSTSEADEWKRRVAAWKQFLNLGPGEPPRA